MNSAPKMLYVQWIDSATTSGWVTPHDVEAAVEPMTCATTGFLVKETESALVLALNHSMSPNTAKPWGDLMTIPKVAITLRRVVR